MNTLRRLRRPFLILAFAAAALAVSAADAFATHFRYGSISWSVPNPAQPNVIRIRFDAAWRRSFPWSPVSNPPLGTVITSPSSVRSGNYAIQIYNAANTLVQTIPLNMTVTGADVTQDIITTSFETNVNLVNAGTYRLQFDDCCRLSTLVGVNADDAFFVTAGVTLVVPANRQPVAATLPIISVQHNVAAASFTIPGFDPDGDPLTYSIPLTAQSGLTQIVPPGLSINSTTGVVTWDTRAPTVLNGLYAVQFRVADNRGAYTSVDVLLRPVNAVGQPPTVRINGLAANQVFNVVRQTPLNFTVNGTDPELAPVTMQSSPLPIGAAMTPSLPTSAPNGVVNSTFHWTPSATQIGTFVITYAVTDGSGQQASRAATITVTNRQPTVMCTASGGTIEATSPLGAAFAITADLADLDNDLLTYRLLIDGSLETTLTNLAPPISIPQSTVVALGGHTYEVQVTDGFTQVSCSGNFSIVDTTAPTLHLPADISLVATAASGAVANFSVTATDTADATPNVSCNPPSGSIFPIFPVDTTTVTCTATDDYSNENTGTFAVTVTPAATSLEALIVAPNGLVGDPIYVNTTLTRTSAPSGLVAGALVRFILTGPSPSTGTMFVPSFTNHEGYAFAAFTPSARGLYTVTAYYDGDLGLQPVSAGPATVTVYQRTQLFVSTTNTTAGEASIQFAELIAQPQGTRLSGRPVNLSFAGPGAPAPVLAVTDAAGRAETFATFAVAGTHTITASFFAAADFMTDAAGTIPPAPTTAEAQIIVTPVFTVFDDLYVDTQLALVGNNLPVHTRLYRSSLPAGPLEGRPVALTLTAPSGATTTQAAITTAGGFVNAVLQPTERGIHTLVATYAGDAATASASSNTASIPVYQRTMLTVPPVIGTAGADVSLNATLVLLPQNTSLGGQPVTFLANGIQPIPQPATTDGTGMATVTGIYAAHGAYTLTAVFDGNADFFTNRFGAFPTAETESASATISAASTSITLNAPSASLVAEPLTVTTTLSRTAAPAGAVGNAFVVFTLTGPGSSTAQMTVFGQTDAAGTATATFVATERGSYSVSVRFGGDQTFEGSTSTPATVGVYQRTQVTLAPVNGGPNSPLSVVATLIALPQNVGLSNQDVQFSFGGVVAPQTAQTGAGGVANVLVTFPSVGSFGAYAAFSNAADFLTDAAGSIPPAPSTADAPVTITDSTPPVITPAITGVLGPNDWYTSNVDVSWNVADPESGIESSSGCSSTTTSTDGPLFTFTCAAASAGGSSTRTVTFKRDATAPTLNLPASFTVPATTTAGAIVNYVATPWDATSGVATFNCAPPSGAQFAITTTTVSCTMTDHAGHSTAGSFAVTVSDTIAPVIDNASPSTGSLWPPNHQMVPITIAVSAADNLGPVPVCSVTGVSSNEAQNGLGDGDTPNDWRLTGGLTLQLRAERAGGGNGRVYTIAITCVDGAGNSAASSTTVSVPKSKK